VAQVKLTDIAVSGFWFVAFSNNPFSFTTSFDGDVTTFDDTASPLSGPTPFSLLANDLGAVGGFPGRAISFCTGSGVETGDCTLFLDSAAQSGTTLDVDGTLHRMILKFDSLALAGTCGDGVVDPGETCDDGNEISGDCCSKTCEAEPGGGACDDGNACSQIDSCDGTGGCVGASPLVCDDTNGCTDDGCDSIAGCQFVDNSAPCDDSLFCNGTDTCGVGSCSIHVGDPCPGPDGDGLCSESCNEGASNCTAADPNGSSCTDTNPCTALDICAAGSCVAGPLLDCDDADECTADSCDESTGCAHEQILGCPPVSAVPTGSLTLQMLTVLAILGFGTRRLLMR
jgi:cysteine-rich repeat protein